MASLTLDTNQSFYVPDDTATSSDVASCMTWGNRCGHDRNNRKSFDFNPHKNKDTFKKGVDKDEFGTDPKSYFIYNLCREVVYRVFDNPKTIRSLGFHNSNSSGRQVRSERREALVLVSQALFHFTNFVTRNFGRQAKDAKEAADEGFIFYDMKFLCAKTGLTLSRVKRAIRDLKAAGFIVKKKRCVSTDGESFKGKSSTTHLTLKFFDALGMRDALKEHQKWAMTAAKKHARNIKLNVQDTLSTRILDPVSFTQNPSAASPKKTYPDTDSRFYTEKMNFDQKKAFSAASTELLINNPEMPLNELYSAANKICNNQ